MTSGDQIRVPLEIGTSSVWSLARASAAMMPGLCLLGLAAAVIGDDRDALKVGLPLAMAGVLLFFFACTHLIYAWRDRPSDVLFSANGLRIEGGPYHGLVIPWSKVDREGCAVKEETEDRLTLLSIVRFVFGWTTYDPAIHDSQPGLTEEVAVHRLYVARKDRERLALGEAERPLEQASLRALLDSVRAEQWYHASSPDAPRESAANLAPTSSPSGVHFVACPECGAPIAPDDAEKAACSYCRAEVLLPEAVRKGVRDSRAISRARRLSDRLLPRLVRQPGARFTGVVFGAAAVPMLLAWPLAVAVAGREWELGAFSTNAGGKLVLFAFSAVLGLFFLLRTRLVDRFALRLLTLGFAARAPEKGGMPFTCRRCGAPLPEVRDSVLAPCIYCGTDNVIGLDLGHRAALETEQQGSLAEALQQRSRQRGLWFTLSVVAMGLFAWDAWLLRSSVPPEVMRVGPPIEVLATSQPKPYALAVDVDSLYWTNEGTDAESGALMKLDLQAGASPFTLASRQGLPQAVILDDHDVYWACSSDGTIRRVDKGGRASSIVASGQLRPGPLALFQRRLYWANRGKAFGEPSGSVMMLTPGDGPRQIASALPEPSSVAVDISGLYFSTRGTRAMSYKDGAIWRAKSDGSEPRVLFSGLADPTCLALDVDTVYWADLGDSTVMRGPKSGGVSYVFAQNQAGVAGIVADAKSLYWVNLGGAVMHAEKSRARPHVLVSGQPRPVALALSYTRVYWLAEGSGGPTGVVARILK